MKACLLFFLLLAVPLAGRPTIEDAIALDPNDPLLGVSFLPVPASIGIDDLIVRDYGWAVAIQGDFAFVSAPVIADAGSSFPGTVHVFQRLDDSWSEMQILAPPDAINRIRFGESLDLSEDGSVLVVGSDDARLSNPSTAVTSGAYVFTRNPATSRYEFLQKLVPSGVGNGDRSGSAVAISGDWIVVGAADSDELFGRPFGLDNGSSHLFQRDPASGLWTEKQKLLPDTSNEEGEFGTSVVIDGPNLCIAAPVDTSPGRDSGRIYLYRLDEATDSWQFEADFSHPNHPGLGKQRFGRWMSFSGDRLLASWDYSEDAEGHTFFFERVAGNWIQRPKLLSIIGGGSNTHQTNSPYSGRRVVQFGNIAVTSGLNVGSGGGTLGSTTMLGEILRFQDGSYTSSAILGDLVVKAAPPAGFVSPVVARARADALATDGTSIIVTMGAELTDTDGTRGALIAVISADPAEVLPRVPPLLFYEDADPAARGEAAFAYQVLLYDDGPGSFITRHDQIDTLYTQVNRDNAAAAEELLRASYPAAAGSTADEFENLFLDLAYGRAAAQLILSKNTVSNLDAERLEIRANLFLDAEIATLRAALDQSSAGIDEYLKLLQDPLGRPPVEGDPAGRALFAEHVPARALFPATDATGAVVAVDGSGVPLDPAVPILPGFKDLVLLHDLFLHHTRSAAELAYLLTARDTPADRAAARALIGNTQRLVFEQRPLLSALFDPATLTPALRETLGLAELDRGIDAALNDLAAFEQNLAGTINLLGYEPDFLMLIQNQGGLFDSFDSFKSILNQTNSPLNVAKNNRAAALTALDSYGANQDALESEFNLIATNSTSALIPRLTEIVGVPIGDLGYDDPAGNVGSEIWQQVQSIAVARTRILRNGAEISNLKQKVVIEQQRRAKEAGINSALSDLIIDYGNRQASMTEEIGRIEAAQAAANAVTEMFEVENITKLVTGVTVVNAAVQAGGEIGKANLEASKERLAASQEAAVRDADDDILDNNSKALVKTLFLEMNTLLIDSQEAELLLRQEAGRLTSLVGEKADLERRLAEVDTQLTARYFADPVHRLRALNTTELATLSFRNARKWLFFAARALEYKWNTPFNLPAGSSSDGRAWVTNDLFRLRNAHELERFFIALVDWDTLVGNNRTFVPYDDWFSLREDYFGYDREDDLTGAPLFYDSLNPTTGQIENVDAVTAFRHSLTRLLEDVDNDGLDELALRFDTLRQNEFDTVVNDYVANLFSPENYLDRLDTIRIFIRGPHQNLAPNDGDNTIPAEISYLGTSVIRNESAGSPISPDRPDRVSGEFTSYPNRFYRFFASGYRFEEGLSFKTAEALKVLPGRSRSLLEAPGEPVAIQAFRERSVATSSWLLVLTPNSGANPGTRLRIDEIDDIELYILHRAVQR